MMIKRLILVACICAATTAAIAASNQKGETAHPIAQKKFTYE